MPPAAARVAVKGRVAVHGPSVAAVVTITPALTVTVNCWLPVVAPSESVTAAVNV